MPKKVESPISKDGGFGSTASNFHHRRSTTGHSKYRNSKTSLKPR